MAVTVSGVGFQPAEVDALDATGHFFTSIVVQPGTNLLEFTAIDQFGQTASATLTLNGIAASGTIDFDQLQDVRLQGSLDYRATTFNRFIGKLHVDARLTNIGTEGLAPVVVAAYDPFRPLRVELANEDGALDDGAPFVSFDSELGSNGLAAGETSAPIRLDLANAGRERFDFDVRLLGYGNTPPEFTSSPRIQAMVDRPYSYTAVANDPDGDPVGYSLTSSPSGMTVAESTGIVTWIPTMTDLGTHVIALSVSDGRGGSAMQTFQLEVIPVPPSRRDRSAELPARGPVTEHGAGL